MPDTATDHHARAQRALADLLGHDEPRPGQVEAIASLLAGRDTVAVLPTGGGKSSIYQAAAALIPGPTVVVSPLISLQHDQRRAAEEADVGAAGVANSTQSERQREVLMEAAATGEVEFLFLAPEQFRRPETLEHLRQAGPSLFVVDEAHCVSAWGHDFRPDYLRLAPVIDALGHPPVLAATATASPVVRGEIAEHLGLHDPVQVVGGFDRPELHLEVERADDERAKAAAVVRQVTTTEGAGLVYVATRRAAEDLAALLRDEGVAAAAYHAGLAAGVRQETQDAFLDGGLRVVVATNAFGMGIDKPDVRFVVHHDVPESLDAYYQEIGRAGRDGAPASALLLWRSEDLEKRRFSGGAIDPERAELEALLAAAEAAEPAPASVEDLAADTDLPAGRVDLLVNLLVGAGCLELVAADEVRRPAGAPAPASAVEPALQAAEERRALARSRVEMVRSYAESRTCRREVLLSYFGDTGEGACTGCDRCDRHGDAETGDGTRGRPSDRAPGAGAPSALPFGVGDEVVHPEWGPGQVVRIEGESVTVLFGQVGYKQLLVSLVLERGLLALPEGA